MGLSFKTLAMGLVVMGIGMGVAYGVGYANGKGGESAAAASAGLTPQQVQQLYGPSAGGAGVGGGAAGGSGAAGATGGTGAAGAGGQGAGVAALLGGSSIGRVTGVSGQTVTIQTMQGSLKLNVGASTTVSHMTNGAVQDLREGSIVVARGNRNSDGSIDATSVSQVPTELQGLAGGGAGASATPTR